MWRTVADGWISTDASFSFSKPGQADKILTEAGGPGGGFFDNGLEFGVFSQLNLEAAARRAAQIVAGK